MNIFEIVSALLQGKMNLPAAVRALDELGYTDQEIRGIVAGALNNALLNKEK